MQSMLFRGTPTDVDLFSFVVQALSHHTNLFPPSDKSTSFTNMIELMCPSLSPLNTRVDKCANNVYNLSVRIFVAILLSGTPAAANQLVITQLYNPAGVAHTLASFLLMQCESSASFVQDDWVNGSQLIIYRRHLDVRVIDVSDVAYLVEPQYC